jgi:hypothetical protein
MPFCTTHPRVERNRKPAGEVPSHPLGPQRLWIGRRPPALMIRPGWEALSTRIGEWGIAHSLRSVLRGRECRTPRVLPSSCHVGQNVGQRAKRHDSCANRRGKPPVQPSSLSTGLPPTDADLVGEKHANAMPLSEYEAPGGSLGRFHRDGQTQPPGGVPSGSDKRNHVQAQPDDCNRTSLGLEAQLLVLDPSDLHPPSLTAEGR